MPEGAAELPFSLPVSAGSSYLVQAALDGGTGGDKEAYIAASGSGGFGAADQNPVLADADVNGLTVVLSAPPQGGAAPAAGPCGGPGGRGGPGNGPGGGGNGPGGPGRGPGDVSRGAQGR